MAPRGSGEEILDPMRGINRAVVLVLATALVAGASALVALFVLLARLPPSDGAHGLSLVEFLAHPFTIAAVVAWTATAGLPGGALALWLLWRTDLRRSVPFVALVTL